VKPLWEFSKGDAPWATSLVKLLGYSKHRRGTDMGILSSVELGTGRRSVTRGQIIVPRATRSTREEKLHDNITGNGGDRDSSINQG